MTKEQAISIPCGAVLYHRRLKNSDGTPLRARVNGRCKTWKTRPDDFRLPVNHGVMDRFHITPHNMEDWELPIEP